MQTVVLFLNQIYRRISQVDTIALHDLWQIDDSTYTVPYEVFLAYRIKYHT